ncbi:MAG: aspartate kinase [candidate division WOR-3 bacterium]|nr:aspartate kinase [candidate division WOR-3 bacterium]MCX7837442.1 aspartate kinase [candidate division WOR-3 bacterium]MDW8114122.1 aspartate kinase [candidate division WOR-3 bacterium]
MRIIVQKFGGSSLADLKRIKKVAKIIKATINKGYLPCVVVSAMGDTTDELLNLAKKINPLPPERELAMLLSCGERISASLLAITLTKMGIEALSFTGSQIGIITDNNFTTARIKMVNGIRLRKALEEKKVPIVMGFQGVSFDKEITLLGRGGSDITAVALAIALKAERCEIYSDVSGVYTEDPYLFKEAKLIKRLTYDEMLEMSVFGAEVLHPRACALASKYNLKLILKSSFNKKGETMISKDLEFEEIKVKGITHQEDLVLFSLINIPKKTKCLHQVISYLAENRIKPIFFSHGLPDNQIFDLLFIVKEEDKKRCERLLEKINKEIGWRKILKKENMASFSLVGQEIGQSNEILEKLFATLTKNQIHIDGFSLSPNRITCFLSQKNLKKAIRILLKAFQLTNE